MATMHTVLALVFAGFLAGCHGYSLGAPPGACGHMTPKHGVDPQTSSPPYNITISSSSYTSGDKTTVTITALDASLPFEGFFIQARKSGSSIPIGTFSFSTPDAGMQRMKCAGGKYDNNAVTHTDKTAKTSKSVMWTSEDGEDVFFQATLVSQKQTFWTNVMSAKLTGDGINAASGHAMNVLVLSGLAIVAFIIRTL